MRALNAREQDSLSHLCRKLRAGNPVRYFAELTHEYVEGLELRVESSDFRVTSRTLHEKREGMRHPANLFKGPNGLRCEPLTIAPTYGPPASQVRFR